MSSALFNAVLRRDRAHVVSLLRNGADPDVAVDGRPLLAVARDASLVGLLLAAGANPNATEPDDFLEPVPVLVAALAMSEQHDCASLLLAAGAEWTTEIYYCLEGFGDDASWMPVVFHADAAKRELKLHGLTVCRDRAFEICVGLQSLGVPAPQLIEIVMQDCEAFAARLPYHLLWDITTAIKHFHQRVHVPQTPRIDPLEAARTERIRLLRETSSLLAANFVDEDDDDDDGADARPIEQKIAGFQFTLQVLRRVLGDSHVSTRNTWAHLACLLGEAENFAGAKTSLEQLLATLEQPLATLEQDGDDEDSDGFAAGVKSVLAEVLYRLGDYAGTKALMEELLAARLQNEGKNHPRTREATAHVARALNDLGELERAKSMLEELVALERRILPADDDDLLESIVFLAMVLRDLRDFVGAKTLLEEVLASKRRTHDELAVIQSALGDVLRRMGNVADAEALLEEATRVLNQPNNDYAHRLDAQLHLGLLRRDQGRVEEALSLIEPLADIEATVCNSETREFFEYRFEFGATLALIASERERAISVMTAVAESVAQKFGAQHHRAVEMRTTLEQFL
jgi:tetratricopeptide (TPR) repeat protein